MKTLVLAFITLLAASFLQAPHAFGEPVGGRTYVVGVSPNLEKPDRESVFKSLVMLGLEGAAPGDVVVVYDALHLQPIARLAISGQSTADQNPRARMQKLKSDFANLQRFFGTDSHCKPEEAGLIRLPQFLDLAGAQLRQPDEAITIIVIGAPYYIDAAEPAFNMTNGAYPSDGHLLADDRASVFGVAGKKGALRRASVHCSYLRDNFANDIARNRLQRFWTLFVGEQGGVLASFAPDVSLVFERARQNIQQPCVATSIDKEDLQIQMHRAGQREIPTIPSPRKNANAPVSTEPPPIQPPNTTALQVKESATELKINVIGDVLFDFDRADMRQTAEPVLAQVLHIVREHSQASVLIEGFTDSRGLASYNLKLSERRAQSVRTWLITKGIAEQKVWARGCGSENSVAANTRADGSDDPEGRQRNRRVEITIKK